MARLPDPLTNPTGPGFKTASLTSKTFGMSHELNGAAIVTVKTVGQQWEIGIQYNTMTQEQFAPLETFLSTLGGNMEKFEIVLPQYRQTGQADLGVATTKVAGTTVVRMDSVTGISVGMLVQFSTSSKVYRIIDIDTGNKDITLNTGLYSAVTSASTAKFEDIEFSCKLSGSPTIQVNQHSLVEGFSLNMKETVI